MSNSHYVTVIVDDKGLGFQSKLICVDPSSCGTEGEGCLYTEISPFIEKFLRAPNGELSHTVVQFSVDMEYDGFGDNAELWATVIKEVDSDGC